MKVCPSCWGMVLPDSERCHICRRKAINPKDIPYMERQRNGDKND